MPQPFPYRQLLPKSDVWCPVSSERAGLDPTLWFITYKVLLRVFNARDVPDSVGIKTRLELVGVITPGAASVEGIWQVHATGKHIRGISLAQNRAIGNIKSGVVLPHDGRACDGGASISPGWKQNCRAEVKGARGVARVWASSGDGLGLAEPEAHAF